MSRRTSEANKAILVAWNKEQELVREGEGTRDWTPEQQQDILDKGKAYDENGRAFEGQHMKSAEKYPEYQGDPENIQFLTRAEHLEAHDGNWQNPTNWYFNPVTKEKLDFGDGSVIPCVIIQLTEPIVSIQLTQKDKNEESPTPVKFVDENKNEDTVGIEISHANLQSNNSKKVNLSEVGFGQNWKRRIKNIGKSILEFSAKHPKMTKMIKGASIVAAAIVTTKIAESTKSGACVELHNRKQYRYTKEAGNMRKQGIKLKDKSTQSKGEYLFDHILYGAFFAYDIYNILPYVTPIAKYNNSIPRLIVCMLLTSMFGIVISYNYNRCDKGVIQDILSGVGLYTVSTLGEYAVGFISWLCIGLLVISVFGIILIITKNVKRKDRIKQIIISRFLRSTQVVRRNVGVAAVIAVVALPIGLNCFQNEKLNEDYYEKICEEYGLNADDIQDGISRNEGEVSVLENYGDEYRLEKNIDTIKLIRDDETFQTLDYEKKCDVLRAVCYCEARYLGLCKINIVFEDIEDDTLLGTYNHATKTITVNSKPIKDGSLPGGTAEELLITVLHECRHCYQNLLSEMYISATPEQRNLLAFTGEGVNDWITNIGDYKPGDETIEGQMEYYVQPIERDARTYAKAEVQIYYLEIDSILDKKTSN